jgi:hypothetical protein
MPTSEATNWRVPSALAYPVPLHRLTISFNAASVCVNRLRAPDATPFTASANPYFPTCSTLSCRLSCRLSRPPSCNPRRFVLTGGELKQRLWHNSTLTTDPSVGPHYD